MAQITLSVSTENESSIEVSQLEKEGDCLSFTLDTKLNAGFGPYTYARDWVTVHGSIADIRLWLQKCLAALPNAASAAEAK